YPSVDTEQFCPSEEKRNETRARLGILDKIPVVGTVSNLNPQKGVEYFVRAATRIHGARPDVRFLLIGAQLPSHPEYYRKCMSELEQSGIPSKQFIMTGPRPDTHNYYPAMDIKLISSRYEGVAVTALEAMSAGLPVVSTNVGGMADVVSRTT